MAAHAPAFTAAAPLPRVSHTGSQARCVRRTVTPFAAASRDAPAASAPPVIETDTTGLGGGGNGAEVGLDVDVPPAVSSFADIDEILRLADEFDLGDLRIESGGISVEITREGGRGFVDGVLRQPAAPQVVAAPPAQVAQWEGESVIESDVQDVDSAAVTETEEEWTEKAEGEETEGKKAVDPNVVYDSDFVVTSNRVGFFFSGARNKPPLVNVGDHVAFNQPVCIIEQLGQQYVYLSEVSGTVTKIFVEDGDAVQYDQQVMVIRPD